MDANKVSPFIEAFFNVLPQVGVDGLERGQLVLKEKLISDKEVTLLVGLSDGIRGNVAYCMSLETAKGIASSMMMGMPVNEFDEMAQSAISELANMVTANAATLLSERGMVVQISPPTMIIGENQHIRVSSMKSISVDIKTKNGVIETNIGIE